MTPIDHVKPADLRRKSKGKRGRRLEPEIDDFDEYAAAKTLILLANCNAGGFCPRSPATRPGFIDITSLPTTQSLTVPPAAAATVNVEKQVSVSPDTPLEAAAINNGRHSCSVCAKRFQSHQALGGHMTSHRLKPQTTTPSDDENVSSAARITTPSDDGSQDLGGHKRKHYEPLIARKEPATSPSISFHIGPDDDDDGAATKLNIDLNMPPAEESDP